MSKGNTKAKAALASAPAPEPAGTPKDPQEVRIGKRSTPDMKALGGSGYALWDTELLNRTSRAGAQWPHRGESADDTNRRNAGVAALALQAFAPQDPIEAMIASQAVALHFATLECARRAMSPQQHPDVSSKLRKDASNSARAMVEMCEALDRRRGKGGQQRIVVERVQVAAGGSAIVGALTTGTPLPASPPAPAAIGQGAPPMPIFDAEPAAVGQGEGERDAGSDG